LRRNLILSVLGACLLVAAASGAAAAAGGSSSTYYAGQNSQGQKLFFTVDHTPRGPEFDPYFINQIDFCPATGNSITVEFSFSGFEIPIVHGKFDFNMNAPYQRFDWQGTLNSTGASGTEYIDLPLFDNEGGLQDCTAGVLNWAAKKLVSASTAPVAPRASYTVKISKGTDGSVQYSVSH
jgi:hypothetical protein